MEKTVNKVLKVIGLILASVNVLVFYSMRPCWSGISKTLGYEKSQSALILNFPPLLFGLLCLLLVVNIVLFLTLKKKKVWNYILLALHVIFFAAIIVVYVMGAKDYARFIFALMAKTMGVIAIVAALIYLIFVYPKSKLKDSKVFRGVMLGAILALFLVYFFNIRINAITYEPVVYAVEDEYQIVFSSRVESQGFVEIGGVKYYDTYAGSQRSTERVHKVSVPMEALDQAGEYTVTVQRYIYRGPFGAIRGKEISQSYHFTAVDASDGLTYYALSDIHMDIEGAKNAAQMTPDFELLVLNGDIISDVETYADANFVNKVAFELTHGEKPVVYARGNHEVKGAYADQLYKFVGSINQKFYYHFYLDGIYGLVLDLGEDHDEGWWEYYGSDDFTTYRNEQIEFLKQEAESRNFENYDYRLVVCHIPLTYINTRHNHVDCKTAMIEELNKMDIDMLLVGHQHELYIFEPGLVPPEETPMQWNEAYGGGTHKGYLLDFNFPSLMCSKHGYDQTHDIEETNKMVGLTVRVDLENREELCYYNNVKLEKIPVVNPFWSKTYGEEITIDLTTKEFR